MKPYKAILISVLAIASLTAICAGVYAVIRPESIKRDISDSGQYGEWYGLLGHTNLLIFPEQIPSSAEQTEYKYYNDANSVGPSCYVFLKCTYDADTFAAENDRIASIDGVRKDTEHYSGDAYVTVLDANETEYALVKGNNTIEYIFYSQGLHPRTPDSSDVRTETAVPADYFSVYSSLTINDFKYWPDSWKH